ncbi:hypothetical protein [Novipirellula artificiosorum]|nr:hypothetical protein [Novipirellula artificiosorum]
MDAILDFMATLCSWLILENLTDAIVRQLFAIFNATAAHVRGATPRQLDGVTFLFLQARSLRSVLVFATFPLESGVIQIGDFSTTFKYWGAGRYRNSTVHR